MNQKKISIEETAIISSLEVITSQIHSLASAIVELTNTMQNFGIILLQVHDNQTRLMEKMRIDTTERLSTPISGTKKSEKSN